MPITSHQINDPLNRLDAVPNNLRSIYLRHAALSQFINEEPTLSHADEYRSLIPALVADPAYLDLVNIGNNISWLVSVIRSEKFKDFHGAFSMITIIESMPAYKTACKLIEPLLKLIEADVAEGK